MLSFILDGHSDMKNAFCAVLQVRGGFSTRPTGMKSQNSFPTESRRRRGSTSPPLVNVEPNPGPHQKKATGKGPKSDQPSLDHHLTAQEKKKIKELIDQGVATAEISRRLKIQEETATRWKLRYEQTGSMEARKSPGRPSKKRSQAEADPPTDQDSHPRTTKQKKKMSDIEKGKVMMGIQMGLSSRKIAEQVDRSHTAIEDLKKRVKANQPLERKKSPGSGAQRKTTKRDDRHYKIAVVRDKDVFAPQAAMDVTDTDGQPVLAPRNVQTRLNEQGLITKKKRKKPAMTKEHMKARLEWAKKHRNWSVERWNRVLWSDESPFTVWPAPRCGKVWVHKGKGLDPRQIEETKKHGGGHITVWGCFSGLGVGTLRRVKGTLKAKGYHNILVRGVLPELRRRTQNEETELVWLFQQDNASVHTAHECTDYLKRKQKEEGFKVLEWPSQSPDLNPIENLWNTLQIQLKKRREKPKNKDELWAQLQEEWANLKDDLLKRLAESMPQRCEDVIAAHGGPTRH